MEKAFMKVARVIWFTGLSGAGKSTLAAALGRELRNRGCRVCVLDGDELRQGICSDLGYCHADRHENMRRIAHMALLLSSMEIIVLVAAITPLQQHRDLVRQLIPDVIEVFVDTPVSVCESRDPKGLYAKARQGALGDFTGISSDYERPKNPLITILTEATTVESCVRELLGCLYGALSWSSPPPYKNDRFPTIAVDFDGVIANYDGWQGEAVLGPTRLDVRAVLGQLKSDGWRVIVHSTRSAESIRPYLDANGVPYDEINSNCLYSNAGPKPVATIYWDDRALRYSGNAWNDLELIRAFRTWNNRP